MREPSTLSLQHDPRGEAAQPRAEARKALFPIQTSIMQKGKAIFLPNCVDPRGCAYTAALLKQVTSLGSAGCGAGEAPHGPVPGRAWELLRLSAVTF